MGVRFYEHDMAVPSGDQTNGIHHTAATSNGILAQVPDEVPANNTEIQLPTRDECRELIVQDLPVLPSPPSIPPDVLGARYDNLNNDICSMLRTSRDPNSLSKNPACLKGIGTYTHVELPPQRPMFPHQQYSTPPPEFLPLGGYGHTGRRCMTEAPHISEPVKAAYEKLREVMVEEEKLGRTSVSPQTRFKGLSLQENNAIPATTTSNTEDIEMNHIDENSIMVDEGDELRRHSVAGVVPKSWDSSRRTSVPGGGPRPAPRRGLTTSGTTYDESRDPRRRGR